MPGEVKRQTAVARQPAQRGRPMQPAAPGTVDKDERRALVTAAVVFVGQPGRRRQDQLRSASQRSAIIPAAAP